MQGHEKVSGAENAPLFPDRIVTALVRLCGGLSALLMLVILAQISVAVVRRYLLNKPLQWNDEMVGYLLVAAVMLGAAEALRRGDHIAIDLLPDRAGPRGRRWLQALSCVSVIGFAVVVGVSIWDSIAFAISFGSYSVGYIEIQTWIPQVPVVIGCVLLGCMALVRLVQVIRG